MPPEFLVALAEERSSIVGYLAVGIGELRQLSGDTIN